jgi:hypothetical protein
MSVPTKVTRNIAKIMLNKMSCEDAEDFIEKIDNISGLNGTFKMVFREVQPHLRKVEKKEEVIPIAS